jgi:hypothetical protein
MLTLKLPNRIALPTLSCSDESLVVSTVAIAHLFYYLPHTSPLLNSHLSLKHTFLQTKPDYSTPTYLISRSFSTPTFSLTYCLQTKRLSSTQLPLRLSLSTRHRLLSTTASSFIVSTTHLLHYQIEAVLAALLR